MQSLICILNCINFGNNKREGDLMEQNKIEKLKEILRSSDSIVFFGGAGVSTESGIPDFRSKDGLYKQKYKYDPEYMLSKDCLDKMPEEFWEFYRDKILIDHVYPNHAHKSLVKLERDGKLKAIVTQNIDNLHEMAGSEEVYHIHGTIMTNHCMECKKGYLLEDIKKSDGIPMCQCGGMVRPDVVLYGEKLPEEDWNKSLYVISQADTLIIAGTSLSVFPAANLIDYFYGPNLIVINKEGTNRDQWADLVIHGNVSDILQKAVLIQ